MVVIPILIFVVSVIIMIVIGFSSQDASKKQQPHIASGNEGHSAKGFYNLADEIRQKAGKATKPTSVATAKPMARKLKEGESAWAKDASILQPRIIRPTVTVKQSFVKLEPSSLQTVTKSNLTVIEGASSANISPLYQRLTHSSIPSEQGNRSIVEAMVLGEVLENARWKEKYRLY